MSSLILDTCALIWLANGGGELSNGALRAIQKAEIVYLSSVSAMEIGYKVATGKLEFELPIEAWYAGALEQHDILEIRVDGGLGLRSAALPPIHRDPADRLIIATALTKHLPVVTHDRRFAEYGVKVLG